MELEKISLNKNIVIYKYLYNWNFSKEIIIEKVKENYKFYGKTPFGNTSDVLLKCDELNEIHTIGINLCKSLTNIIDTEYSDTNFIYLQTNNTRHSVSKKYHTHINTIVNGKPVLNDWTYCFYLQMPKNIKNNESKIAFKDKDDNVVYYLPKEGEFIIFDAALQHGPEPIHNAECDRITIVGTVAFNVHQKNNSNNKNIL